MDIFNISKSIDELIYDVMMWIIFFPYTLVRIIVHPGQMIDYVASELRKDIDTERFDRGIAPPLFLFLAIIIGWLLAPDVAPTIAEIGKGAVSKALAESSWNLLMYRMVIFCAFPLAGATIYEWRTPGGITRQSFRKPFYQQAYLCAPLAIVLSFGLVILGGTTDELLAAIIVLCMLAIFIWYIWAQGIFFHRSMGSGWIASAFWALLAVLLGLAIFFTLALTALR